MTMLIALLRWWYSAGLVLVLSQIYERSRNVYLAFSIPLLTRTLFAPWRRIITLPSRSIQAQLRAALDNTVSRGVGFWVRSTVIVVGLCASAATAFTWTLLSLVWVGAPLFALYCLIRSVV